LPPESFAGIFRARLAAVGRADYRYAGTPQTASQEGAIMTDPAPRPCPVARWRVLALLAAAALLAGCELATGTVRTASQLQDAGIRNPNLQYNNGVATLRYDADPNPLEARTEQDRAPSSGGTCRSGSTRSPSSPTARSRTGATTRERCWSRSWARGRPTWTDRWPTSPAGPP
jgi:hypothetical protein